MPTESKFSDDNDFMVNSKQNLETLLPVTKSEFSDWNLQNKNRVGKLNIAGSDELKDDGTPLKISEDWCSDKLLGSLMCCSRHFLQNCGWEC